MPERLRNRTRITAATAFAIMWAIATMVREANFETSAWPWWAMLGIAVGCAFASGWLFGCALWRPR